MFSSFLGVCVYTCACASEHRCVLLVFPRRAHTLCRTGVVSIQELSSLSDPRYLYISTVEDRSPGLKLPHIHPSKGFQRQPSTRITHSHAAANQIFRCFPLFFPVSVLWVSASRRHVGGRASAEFVCIFKGTTLFPLNSSFPSRHFE